MENQFEGPAGDVLPVICEKCQVRAGDLAGFTGTDTWHRHSLRRDLLYTDGVQYLAKTAGAYWLIDEIMLAQWHRLVKAEEFQVWRLTKHTEDSGATLLLDDGNGNKIVTREIEYTDFPLPEVKLYFENGVLMLPSER